MEQAPDLGFSALYKLANVAVADRIVVLDRGRLVQEGTYEQLTHEPGLFRTLWALEQRTGHDVNHPA